VASYNYSRGAREESGATAAAVGTLLTKETE
jgi:hypothetical protein